MGMHQAWQQLCERDVAPGFHFAGKPSTAHLHDGDAAEDLRPRLRLLPVVVDDLLERHLRGVHWE